MKRTLLPGLVTIWLYSGFVRLYLFPQFAQIIYFLPYAILALITLRLFFQEAIQKSYYFLYLCLLFSSLIFQSVHIMFGNIDFKTAIYGLSLYIIPLALITQMPLSVKCNSNHKCERIILNSVIPNFILVVLQTLNSSPRYLPTLDNTEHLESANGVARAFGTFSSTTGFSYYLTLCTCILIIDSKNIRTGTRYLYWICIPAMYILSGSRTVIFSAISLILISFLFGGARIFRALRLSMSIRIILVTLFSVILVRLYFWHVFEAFAIRFQTASQQENTIRRITNSIFGFLSQSSNTLWGEGLGSRSIGTYSYSLSSGWIENDLPRIIVEAGPILGLLIIFARWLFIGWLLFSQAKYTGFQRHSRALLIGAVFPVVLFGQFMGQGSLSLGVWITIFLCLTIPKSAS